MARRDGDDVEVAWGNRGEWLDRQLDAQPQELPPAPDRPTLEDLVERAAADPGRLAYYLCEDHPDHLAERLGIDAHHITHLQLCWLPTMERWNEGIAEVALAIGVQRQVLDALLREALARTSSRPAADASARRSPRT